ncbi:MAG: HU family DNA-binding protein, partial [Acidithiobacillus sp.]
MARVLAISRPTKRATAWPGATANILRPHSFSTKTHRVISQREGHPMHKQELITQVAKAAEVSQQKAATVIDAVIHAITNAMAAGESVSLVGFGSF